MPRFTGFDNMHISSLAQTLIPFPLRTFSYISHILQQQMRFIYLIHPFRVKVQ